MTRYKPKSITIGNLIRQLRTSKGLSQMKLAQMVGLSYQQIQKYENGTTQLTVPRLRQLANALEAPIQTFIQIDPGVAETAAIKLTSKEIKLLHLFRSIESESLKSSIIKMINDVVKESHKS